MLDSNKRSKVVKMDFRQSFQSQSNRQEPVNNSVKTETTEVKTTKAKLPAGGLLTILSAAVLVGAVLLLLGAAFFFTRSSDVAENKYVDTSKYQAVFLNNGQVYFGKIANLNGKYVDLKGVYYLTQAAATNGQASSDYTLVKLGCQQIHYPNDQMLINRDQVTFWENLNTDGKVTKSIEEFKKQNPNGENCKDATQTQTQSSTVPTQSSTQASQSTTPTTNATTNTNTNTTTR